MTSTATTRTRHFPDPRVAARYALAGLWLLDGALQLQPFMFTRGFANDILLPAAQGQPGVIAAPMQWSAHLIASHPILSNTSFAAVQLLLGLGLLAGRAPRLALAASVVWSLSVWWLGEGLGGLTSGHAMLLTGAPGAVLVYVVLAVLAWPSARGPEPNRESQRVTAIPIASWSALWLVGAVYQLLPGQNSGRAISAAISGATANGPTWLAHAGTRLAEHLPTGHADAIALAAVQALIGLLVVVPGRARRIALCSGGLLALAFWVFGQSLGGLNTGQATDPNTAPILVLLAGLCWIASPAHAAPRRVEPDTAASAGHPGLRGLQRARASVPSAPVTISGVTAASAARASGT